MRRRLPRTPEQPGLLLALVLGLALPASALAQEAGDAVPMPAMTHDASTQTAASQPGVAEDIRPAIALMGTIPIYWGEANGLAALLDGSAAPHWAKAVLAAQYRLMPLDYLEPAALAAQSRLLLAQPRALSPPENVALDRWVRDGGNLLLFADPMMTGESRFALGDRRRPQDVALLSPILGHWGLRLEFLEDQSGGLHVREIAGLDGSPGFAVPVNLPGRLVSSDGDAECTQSGDGVLAQCRLGAGRVTILADGALLDFAGPWPGAGEALSSLVESAFAESGDFAGGTG